jgi:hypothetical protein
MLLRREAGGVVAIPQPAHAWLSGQMAAAWGNARFERPSPRAEVCLGAEQHDIGWLPWETEPTLDHETGYPQEFMKVPPAVHVALWREGVRRARAYGRYPALLVSLHAYTIYSRFFDFETAPPAEAQAVREFLAEQAAWRAEVIASLRSDPQLARDSSDDAIERNRRLVAALDWISLQLCWGVTQPARIPKVPVSGSEVDELTLAGLGGDHVAVDPWPFEADILDLHVEGRRLRRRFSQESEMRSALWQAEPAVIEIRLRPSSG